MFAMKSDFVLFLILFHVCNSERRIQEGRLVTKDKPYVVYIIKAPIAMKKYDYWMCGGAIIHPLYVITSAACIGDVNYMYVIAGYNKYVTDDEIEKDPCTKEKKKKVIFTCFPQGYDIAFDRLSKWSLIDIGVVRVESPFDFNDQSYLSICSYMPKEIPVNFDSKYQEPGTDAMVLGWGHPYYWRKEKDTKNYNEQYLHYAPVSIMDKERCKEGYEIYSNMSEVIDKYMICSDGTGAIDDTGAQIDKAEAAVLTCSNLPEDDPNYLRYPESANCKTEKGQEEENEEDIYQDYGRKFIMEPDTSQNTSMKDANSTSTEDDDDDDDLDVDNSTSSNITLKRRSGICQNDHGGPLVTWVGTHEVLIGVASVFRVAEDYACIGPYLYTSTQCNSAFVDCVLRHEKWPEPKLGDNNMQPRRTWCKTSPTDKGHATIERHISWANHPDGPAENEKHEKPSNIGPDGKKHVYEKNVYKDEKPKPVSEYVMAPVTNKSFLRYRGNDKVNADYNYAPKERYPANERYPTNVRYPTNERYPISERYQAYERQTVSERYFPNARYTDSGRYEYPANNRYTASERYQAYERFTVSDRNPANERHIERERYPDNERHTISDRYPAIQRHTVSERYPAQERYIVSERYPPIERNTVSERYPAIDKHIVSEKYPVIERHTAGERYPAIERHTVSERYPANERHTISERYPAIERYTASERYPANERHTISEKYPAMEKYAATGVYTNRGHYPPNAMYTINMAYAPYERYTFKSPYAQMGKLYTVSEKYAASYQYALNDKYILNNPYAANVKYTARNPYVPYQNYTANKQYIANYQYNNQANMKYSPNDKYIANVNYAPNERYKPNDKYGHMVYEKYAPNEKYIAHDQLAHNFKYLSNVKFLRNREEPKLIARPQRPL